MKTKIAALSLVLLASAGTAALAQEHGRDRDGVRRDRSEASEARARAADRGPRREAGEVRPNRPPEAPQAQTPRQPPQAPEARGDRGDRGDRGGFQGRRPLVDNDGDRTPTVGDRQDREDRNEARTWDRWNRDGQGGRRPDADGRRDGDRRDGDRRDGDRRDGDRNGPRGDNDGRRDGDRDGNRRWDGDRDGRRGDHNDGRRWDGDRRGPPKNWPRWDGRRYPHSYNSRHRYRGHIWRPPSGFYIRLWTFGDILPSGWYEPNYRILDWWDYDLPMPPVGYAWVRVGDDALLVDQFNGRVIQVVRYVFW